MSVFLRLASFALACMVGVGVTFLSSARWRFQHECPRFEGINPSERFFTLAEGKERLGRRVRYAHPTPYPQNSGRVISLDMIVSDKFFIVIYWDATPHEGTSGLRWYSRDDYERNIVEE
jgi:hypothetical protein